MINNERELEDYIVHHQEEFIKALRNVFYDLKDKEIQFVGRQINIGKDNRADLLYCYEDKVVDPNTNDVMVNDLNYIVVELKFRDLQLEDLGQISRYMSILEKKINDDSKRNEDERYCNVLGVFVSFGMSKSFQEVYIAGLIEKIGYITVESQLDFYREGYSKDEEYIKKIQLDSRIEALYERPDEN